MRPVKFTNELKIVHIFRLSKYGSVSSISFVSVLH